MIGDLPGDWVGDLGCEELGRGVAQDTRGIIFGSGTQGDALGCGILPRWGGDSDHRPPILRLGGQLHLCPQFSDLGPFS